jgi:hypothetical protein
MIPSNVSTKRMRPFLKLEMPQKKDEKYNLCSVFEIPTHKKTLGSYPNITKINILSEFFTYLNLTTTVDFFYEKTLVVFDIDEVLLHKRTMTSINSKSLIPGTDNCINELSNHADVICLTARSTATLAKLEQHGIDLLQSNNKITLTQEQEKELNNFSYSYYNNIIYTNYKEKGTALKTIYSYSKTAYDKVFFIDDCDKNWLSVLYRMHDNNMPIISCNLLNTEQEPQKPCSLNLNGYPTKEKPFFHSEKEHSSSYSYA